MVDVFKAKQTLLQSMLENELFLACLEEENVSEWSGYGSACDEYHRRAYTVNNLIEIFPLVELLADAGLAVISQDKYNELLDDQRWKNCLEDAGVDNWSGIDFAKEAYNNEDG